MRKSSQVLRNDADLVAKPVHLCVSRSGVKLSPALAHFDFDPNGKICIDVGASTGGFTDVLLRGGARRVYAVDVGTGQLHPSIAGHPDIIQLEKVDARNLDRSHIPEPAGLITVDVSSISLKLIVRGLAEIAASDATLIALVKPQFEAGKKLVRKGIVRDATVQKSVCDNVATFVKEHGWHVLGVTESPIEGGDGNREFLLCARREGGTTKI